MNPMNQKLQSSSRNKIEQIMQDPKFLEFRKEAEQIGIDGIIRKYNVDLNMLSKLIR